VSHSDEAAAQGLVPPGTRIRVLATHKAGHVTPCIGLARALGCEPDVRDVAPRGLWLKLAPLMPPDPRDSTPLAEPWPEIVIASARETVAYLRAIVQRSQGKVFTVFLGDPRMSRKAFNLIWTPVHDRIEAANVIKTVTAPHPHNAASLAALRERPDPRIARLPHNRIALFVGGPGGRFKFSLEDFEQLGAIARTVLESGASLMVSPSRRTPPQAIAAIARACAEIARREPHRVFLWDGAGENPFASMLALADGFIVTADSVNMTGEAASTGRPVQIFTPAGGAGKTQIFLDALAQHGAIRPWQGALEEWAYAPLDATREIADEVARRYAAFRAQR